MIARHALSYLRKRRSDRPNDAAYTLVDGRRIYLGRYDSLESRDKYRRVVAEWQAYRELPVKPDVITVDEDDEDSEFIRVRKRNWARLIQKV